MEYGWIDTAWSSDIDKFVSTTFVFMVMWTDLLSGQYTLGTRSARTRKKGNEGFCIRIIRREYDAPEYNGYIVDVLITLGSAYRPIVTGLLVSGGWPSMPSMTLLEFTSNAHLTQCRLRRLSLGPFLVYSDNFQPNHRS